MTENLLLELIIFVAKNSHYVVQLHTFQIQFDLPDSY